MLPRVGVGVLGVALDDSFVDDEGALDLGPGEHEAALVAPGAETLTGAGRRVVDVNRRRPGPERVEVEVFGQDLVEAVEDVLGVAGRDGWSWWVLVRGVLSVAVTTKRITG